MAPSLPPAHGMPWRRRQNPNRRRNPAGRKPRSVGRDPAQFHQIMHGGVGFLGITRPIIEHVAVGGVVAQDTRPGEGAEEQHPTLKRVGNRDAGVGVPTFPMKPNTWSFS